MAASKFSNSTEQPAASDGLPVVPWDRVERFVGQLTHDVRNGLNALELQLTFLGEISTDPEAVGEIKQLRHTLGNVTRHLQTLRAATGMTTPYPLDYPAGEFFEDLRERAAKTLPGSGAAIVWHVETDPEALLAVDPELTINALLELLGNALHFAQSETRPIKVLATVAEDHAVILLQEAQSVAPTISPEDWGRTPLFTTRRGSYGLGLFRVRRILEAQGGTLEVDYSAAENILTTKVMLRATPPKQP